MAKAHQIKVELENEYSFGKTVTANQTTLEDELDIEKKVIANDGAGQSLFLIASSCGLTQDEAKSIYSSDARKIIEALNAF